MAHVNPRRVNRVGPRAMLSYVAVTVQGGWPAVTLFRALIASGAGSPAKLQDLDVAKLGSGDTLVRIAWSGLSRTDSLAITGSSGVQPGIRLGQDLAGTVVTSAGAGWRRGDLVVAAGVRPTPSFIGGLAEYAWMNGELLIPLAPGLAPEHAMIIGTPGLATALALELLEAHAVTPERGPIFVTGASGGLGSLAVALLASLGYEVTAITRRLAHANFLRVLGAAQVLPLTHSDSRSGRSAAWAGGIDLVGGPALATLLSQVRSQGAVVSCADLAGGVPNFDLSPFVRDGVCLLGCDAFGLGRAASAELWERIARILQPATIKRLATAIGLEDVVATASDLLAGRTRGRIVVEIAPEGAEGRDAS